MQRNSFVVLTIGLAAALATAGCGNQYRPVVSAINPVGPAGQPTKYAVAVSNPSPGTNTPGLLTIVDFSGDTILSTPQILTDPSYFVLNSSGSQGYTINANGSLNTFLLSNPTGLITSNVVQTTLPINSSPVSITAITPASEIASIFIPQQASSSVAALNSSTAALYDDISVGNSGSNPVYVVGATGAPRIYVLSENAPGSFGQIDALESTSTLQLSISKTITVGHEPVYGVMTSDDRRAFILNKGSGTVSVVNVTNNALDTPTPTITIPPIKLAGGGTTAPNPVWADLAPTVTEMVVLNQGDGTHPGTLSIVEIPLCNAIAQPSNPLCDPSNPVDAAGFGTIVATATVGIKPTMVSVLQDGSAAYVINSFDGTGTCGSGEGSVSVVSLASGQITATICGISGAAASPAVASSAGLIFGQPNSISTTTGTPTGKVYVTSGDSNYMSVIYTDTNTVQGHINLQGKGLRVLVTSP
jgi:DNA-binding beta-propeller fold protein YncE